MRNRILRRDCISLWTFRPLIPPQGFITLRPSLVGVAARLKLYSDRQPAIYQTSSVYSIEATYLIAFFPGSTGTETKTDKCWPCSSLEKEDGEDNTEGCAEGRTNEHCAEAVVPLQDRQ